MTPIWSMHMNYYSSLKLSQANSVEVQTMWNLMEELQGYVLGMATDKKWNEKYDTLLQKRSQSKSFEDFANDKNNQDLVISLIRLARQFPAKEVKKLKDRAIKIINDSQSVEINEYNGRITIEIT